MLESYPLLVDEPDPVDFSNDLSSKKSEMVIALITLVILGTKAVPAKLVQLKSLFSLGPSGRLSTLLLH